MVEGECFYFFCFFTFITVPLSSLSLSFMSSTIYSISFLSFCGRWHKMTHKGWCVMKPQLNQSTCRFSSKLQQCVFWASWFWWLDSVWPCACFLQGFSHVLSNSWLIIVFCGSCLALSSIVITFLGRESSFDLCLCTCVFRYCVLLNKLRCHAHF